MRNFHIQEVKNGLVLTHSFGDEDERESFVFQYKEVNFSDGRKDELASVRELFYSLMELLGYHYNDHERYNLQINVLEGDEPCEDSYE